MTGKRSIRDSDELVQEPGNPATQIDKDDIPEKEKSREGYPLKDSGKPGERNDRSKDRDSAA